MKFTKLPLTSRTLNVLCLAAVIFLFMREHDVWAAQRRYHKTTGSLQEIKCSSKDCVVAIKKRNGQEALFIIYDDFDSSRFIDSFENADKYVGRIIEVTSDKDRVRGDLEMVKSIRFVNKVKR